MGEAKTINYVIIDLSAWITFYDMMLNTLPPHTNKMKNII